jgi:hypothetical protein
MAPKQGDGRVSFARISASPVVVSGTAPLVAATASPHTTLAATCVTGPAVFPALGNTSPRTSTLSLPLSVSTAAPCLTTQGAPPLPTPAIVTFGFEPTIGATNANSSANVLMANAPANTQAVTAVVIALFMFEEPLIPEKWREV